MDPYIVFPGEFVGKEDEVLPGPIYIENGKAYSKVVGIKELRGYKIKITPLRGVYMPKTGDLVIGKIIEVLPNGWQIDINSPYNAFLLIKDALNKRIDISAEDLNEYFTYGEYIVGKIIKVSKNRIINITTKGEPILGKINQGIIITINPNKVPRVIGKNGSMIKLIKDMTKSPIFVGQNGRIWIKTEDPNLQKIIISIIKYIDEHSHLRGLTDKVKELLEKYLS